MHGMAATVGKAKLCLNTVTHNPSQKYMHKVHTVAEFRHLCYESWRFRIAYASKSEERTRRKKHTVNRTESPSYFYYRCGMEFAGYSLHIE